MPTPSGDESLQRLRAALEDLTAADALDVVREARAEARDRVRSMLSEAMSRSLLESIEQRLASVEEPPPAAAPASASPPAASPTPTSDDARTEAPAWYVYGVVGAPAPDPGDDVLGVDGSAQVTTLHEGSLAAVVSQVAAHEFDDTNLRANLGDMAWVERLARAHEAVLDTVRRHVTVIPMRMCTVYRTEGGVREMLRREAESFDEALAHLEGKAEWGVKVLADPAAAEPDPEPDPGPSSGADYMQRRRQDLERHELASERVQEAAAQIHERLCALAVDGLVAPPQRPEASGHPGQMVLNGVYLVRDDDEDEFAREVSSLGEEFGSLGLDLILTGPWPAYNFVPGTIGAAW